jgi:serine protease inhibitor
VDETGPRAGDHEAAALAAAVDAAGCALYREIAGTGGRDNLVFSPVSIAIALQMALHGARGETAAQLARFLQLPSPEAGATALPLLTASLTDAARPGAARPGPARAEPVTFRAPNAMWVQSGLALRPEFAAWIGGLAGADVRDADFAHEAEKVRLEINRMIAEQTEQKITGLLAPGAIDAATRLVLTNAVYLKAAWAHPFPAADTRDAPFHLAGGGAVTARMMRVTARFGYLRGEGYQMVTLPYAGTRLAMAVILPDGPLPPLERRLCANGLGSLLGRTRAAHDIDVALSMPRFRVTNALDMEGVLARLGVTAAFGPDADFSGITTDERLSIGKVAHKAYIDVDETGTEAAAATAVTIMLAAVTAPTRPVTVTVDRPFLFAIVDTAVLAHGVPLFLGRVTAPAVS